MHRISEGQNDKQTKCVQIQRQNVIIINQLAVNINDENINSVKSQVIKREFNGVKQFQEEKKRLTEGDKLVLVDINKNIEKFKQSITTATSNLLDGKKKPLNDLFFNFNSLMVAYNNLIQTAGRNLISQSVLADIKNKLELIKINSIFNQFLFKEFKLG